MHAISTITLLASLSMGILAQSPGTFDTFTDPTCAEGGRQSVTVPQSDSSGELGEDVLSVRSNLESCYLLLFTQGTTSTPQVIPPGGNMCVELLGPGRQWSVACP